MNRYRIGRCGSVPWMPIRYMIAPQLIKASWARTRPRRTYRTM